MAEYQGGIEVSKPEQKLKELGLELPQVTAPVGSYIPATQWGNLVFTSGQLPVRQGQLAYTGKLGGEVSIEEGYEAARTCALNALAAIKDVVGSLDRVEKVVKVVGFVASAEGFTSQPQVVNGASDLLKEVFGEAGVHARSAVGMAELPLGAPVEVELVVAIKP